MGNREGGSEAIGVTLDGWVGGLKCAPRMGAEMRICLCRMEGGSNSKDLSTVEWKLSHKAVGGVEGKQMRPRRMKGAFM